MDMVEHDDNCTKHNVKMINFEFNYKATHCVEWPKLKIFHNSNPVLDVVCDSNNFQFSIEEQERNKLEFFWYNKTQKHTLHENGKILKDQTFELGVIRADNILIEDWFMTDGFYKPHYFKGFVDSHKKERTNFPLLEELPSQKIWHFPGKYYFKEWHGTWWDWYYKTKTQKEVVKFTEKDPERIEKYRGTLDPCTDLNLCTRSVQGSRVPLY